SDERVVLTQFQPPGVGTAVLGSDVHVPAFGAFQLDDNPVPFFRHRRIPFLRLCPEPLMGFEPMTPPLPRVCSTPELQRHPCSCLAYAMWAGLDSNQRRLSPMNLQSIPFSHSGTDPDCIAAHKPPKALEPLTSILQVLRSAN